MLRLKLTGGIKRTKSLRYPVDSFEHAAPCSNRLCILTKHAWGWNWVLQCKDLENRQKLDLYQKLRGGPTTRGSGKKAKLGSVQETPWGPTRVSKNGPNWDLYQKLRGVLRQEFQGMDHI